MTNIFGLSESGSSSKPDPIKPGTYDAVLYGIIDLGKHEKFYQGQSKGYHPKIKMLFEIPELKTEEGENRLIGKEFYASLSDKSNFYKFLFDMEIVDSAGAIGKIFATKDSTMSVLGRGVSLKVSSFTPPDKEDAISFVEKATKLDSRLPQPEGDQEIFVFAFSDPDMDVFQNKLTKFGRAKVMAADNSEDLPKDFHLFYKQEVNQEG